MKTLLVLLAFLLITPPAMAREDRVERKAEKLNLTSEQREKIRALRKNNRADREKDREKFQSVKEEFQAGLKDPQLSREELLKRFDTFQKEQQSFQRKRFERLLEIREVLTPEQRARFNELQRDGDHKKGKSRKSGKRKKD